jgi:hypothetical protein
MELSKETLDSINKAVEADQIAFKQAAENLGLTLNDGAISGRRQGYFKGMMDEALRSQKVVEALFELNAMLDDYWNNGRDDVRVKRITAAQQKSLEALNQYNTQP